MKMYLWKMPDGRVVRETPGSGWKGELTLARNMKRIAGVGDGVTPPLPWIELEEEDVPHCLVGTPDHSICSNPNCEDRWFRNAVVWDDSSPTKCRIDMPKARGVHMDKIRAVRNAELVKEDIIFMRAVEAGDTSAQAAVATKKQVLRDIPATFDITTGLTTPELLKAKWPSELPARE